MQSNGRGGGLESSNILFVTASEGVCLVSCILYSSILYNMIQYKKQIVVFLGDWLCVYKFRELLSPMILSDSSSPLNLQYCGCECSIHKNIRICVVCCCWSN